MADLQTLRRELEIVEGQMLLADVGIDNHARRTIEMDRLRRQAASIREQIEARGHQPVCRSAAERAAEPNRDASTLRRGLTIGMAMSIAFMLRAGAEVAAQEWWVACGLTLAELEAIGVDEYDLEPIRSAGLDQREG